MGVRSRGDVWVGFAVQLRAPERHLGREYDEADPNPN